MKMTFPVSLTPYYLGSLVAMATLLACSQGQQPQESRSQQDITASLVARMDKVQQQLADATSQTQQMLSEIERGIFDCIGTHSELCEAAEVEAGLADQLGLQSPWAPGKRTRGPAADKTTNRMYNELHRKKSMAQHLNVALRSAGDLVRNEKKRSCSLNLGFHCQTSDISKFADWYDFVASKHSPGKKRSVDNMPAPSSR